MPLSARFKKTIFISGLVLWLGAAAWGSKQLNEYSFRPGEKGASPANWPANARFSPARGICTLVVALHPECPCSRATLSELDSILCETTTALHAIVVFLDTDSSAPADSASLFKSAQQMAGVSLVRDPDGEDLKRFGFVTSGEVRLYGPDGTLIFSGGITGSRGHVGENPGRSAVITAVREKRFGTGAAPTAMPVFGCALFSSAERR